MIDSDQRDPTRDAPEAPSTSSVDPTTGDEDDLVVPEVLLLKLGDEVPNPVEQTEPDSLYACLIGVRARSLYQNFLYSLASPAPIAPILALRPLVEAAILIKWISLDPDLNGQLWFGQSEAQDLKALREVERHLGRRVRGDIPEDEIEEALLAKETIRNAARARATEAERNYGGRVMPGLERMVQEIEEADTEHRVAMRQAYDAVYRSISPWMHTEAGSFKATAELRGDAIVFLGDQSPYVIEHLRVIAGAMFAYVLEVVGVSTGLGGDIPARFIRDYLTIYRPLVTDGDNTNSAAVELPRDR